MSTKKYDKYEKRGALHWWEYRNHTYYEELVDDSLIPFDNIKKGTLLDVGCGDGLHTQLLYQRGFDVTGVEVEELGIKYAREMCSNKIEFINSSIEDFLKSDRSFDYLYCLNTIEHLEDTNTIIEVMKNIKNFGVIITDDNEARSGKVDKYHVREFTKGEFKNIFKDFELEELKINNPTYFGYKVKNRKI